MPRNKVEGRADADHQGADPGLFSRPLIEEWMTPMLTPDLAASLKTKEDLAAVTLVHDDLTAVLKPSIDWSTWFRAVGIDPPEMHGPRFNLADHAVGAALAGVGAILGRLTLTSDALRDGRLVMPFAETLHTGAHYRLVCPEGTETRPQVAAFIDWIERQFQGLKDFDESRSFLPRLD